MSSSRQSGERGVDGLVVPRTGTGERVVLAHSSDTRRVPFGVGNDLVVSRTMTGGL
jgi:hypothetical protein